MRPKTLWHVFRHSLTSPSYYLEVIKQPLGFSLRFFLMFIAILGVIAAARFVNRELPQLQTQLEYELEQASNYYPEEVTFTWTGQFLESNLTEPLKIPYPQTLPNSQTLPNHLASIIAEELSADELAQQDYQDSLLAVTPTHLYVNDLGDRWTGVPLSSLVASDSFTISKDTFPQQIEYVKQRLATAIDTAATASWLVIPIGLVLIRLWSALFEGVLVYFLVKLNRVSLSLHQVFQLSLHITVIAATVNQIAMWLYPHLTIPMFALAYWITFTYVFWGMRSKLL